MTALSEYPGEKMPYWAVAIWYRCKFCKICVQFEEQLIRHKREKHPDKMNRSTRRICRQPDVAQPNSASDRSEEDDEESLSSSSSDDEEDEIWSSPPSIPPVIDLTDALTGSENSELDQGSEVRHEYESRQEDSVSIQTISNAVEIDFEETSQVNVTAVSKRYLKPVIIGCDRSDEEIEISHGNSVQQLKHVNSKKSLLPCCFCNKTFKSELAVKQHLNKQHTTAHMKTAAFNCPFCKKKFLSQFMKEKHVQSCRQPFNKRTKKRSQSAATATLKTVDIQNPKTIIQAKLNCQLRSSRTLQTSSLKIKPGESKPKPSPSRTSRSSSNKKVGRGRPRNRPFACKFCSLTFKQKGTFTRHLISKHSRIRNYSGS